MKTKRSNLSFMPFEFLRKSGLSVGAAEGDLSKLLAQRLESRGNRNRENPAGTVICPNLRWPALRIGGVTLGLLSTSCVFHPPPPLADELAENQPKTQVARSNEPGKKSQAGKSSGADTKDANKPAGSASTASDATSLSQESSGRASENSAQSGSNEASASSETVTIGEPLKAGMSADEIKVFNQAQGDPFPGGFPLDLALDGVEGEGNLWVEFNTSQGKIDCRLFEDRSPWTVANFVGLARGLRPYFDRTSRSWSKKPYFDGSEFHRVIPGFMIQGGDLSATGMGNPGYVIVDEFADDLVFDRPGLLAMANRGPSTGGSQFFITLAPVSHLNRLHTIFGECSESGIKVAESIAGVARGSSDRPTESQVILEAKVLRR